MKYPYPKQRCCHVGALFSVFPVTQTDEASRGRCLPVKGIKFSFLAKDAFCEGEQMTLEYLQIITVVMTYFRVAVL